MERSNRRHYHISTACGAQQGLEMIERLGPYAVVVSDYQMPGMNGISFLACVRQIHPDSVRILLTGNAESHLAIGAVNRGQIFRFLTKPCDEEILRAGLNLGIEKYRARLAGKERSRRSLLDVVELVTDALALAWPDRFGIATAVRRRVEWLANAAGESEHLESLELAALLAVVAGARAADSQTTATADGVFEFLARSDRWSDVRNMLQELLGPDSGHLAAGKGVKILRVATKLERELATGSAFADVVRAMRASSEIYDGDLLSLVERG